MSRIKIKPIIKQNLSSFPPSPIYPPSPCSNNHKSNSNIVFARNIVIVLGILLFICVLLHFVIRYFMNKKRSVQQSSRFQESGNNNDVTYERQLQQLFNLHDSGLDQAFIDALPLFLYKELMGLKEPFDCAVCLCEFSENDKLRLLPLCSHAFHIHCIDTWLLSNSSCPLCRGSLFSPGFDGQNPIFDFHFNDLMEEEEEEEEDEHGVSVSGIASSNFKQNGGMEMRRVFPVRLGKFRATNVNVNDTQSQQESGKLGATNGDQKEMGETSSNSNVVDARRCFSMGSYEYVVGNSELQVTFCPNRGNIGKKDLVVAKDKGINSSVDAKGIEDGKKISSRSKGESFSVSKIWLWSKKDQHKFQDSSSANHMIDGINSSVNDVSLQSRKSSASNFDH
uniref:RING-H2 finger protein ATL47-like n=1 Tax=Erigeron canadensis TaxID=72917 RepID=UPI001CB8A928|nr:RING-H2 finger protein ATL47-like [Erigeron canadensis]